MRHSAPPPAPPSAEGRLRLLRELTEHLWALADPQGGPPRLDRTQLRVIDRS